MPTERVELGPAHVQRALEAAGEGVYRSSDPLVFADSSRNGLAIRGVARRATWVVRWKRGGKERTVTLGEVLPSKSREKGIRSTALARALAREVRHRLDAGLEVTDAWLAARRLGQGADEAESTASRKADADAGRWRWEDLVEHYVQEVIAQPTETSGGRVRPPSQKAIADARRYLADRSLDHVKGRLLTELSEADFEKARNLAYGEGRVAAQRKVITYSKAALKWARRFHQDASGLKGGHAVVERVGSLCTSPAGTAPPSVKRQYRSFSPG